MWANDVLVGSEISWWFPNILSLESGLIGMVPKNPGTRARINRNGSHSSGSEISCDTGHGTPVTCTLVAVLSDVWPDRVSARTAVTGVDAQRLGESAHLICNVFLSVDARRFIWKKNRACEAICALR